MKKIFSYIMLLAVTLSGLTLTACSEDELSTNQYDKSGVNILAFGPMPVTRGETIRLTGTQLNKVKEVLFPEGNQKLTPATTYIAAEFTLTNSEEMTVTIPDMCVPGKLRLVTTSNDTVVSASNITFEEEIKVTGINPSPVHPGDIVTISGEYVWNIADVTFTAGVKVEAEDFVLNTRKEIQVRVPMEAVTGPVTCTDGSENAEPIVVTDNLVVDVAVATSVSNATPEFGNTITITGENLDLVTKVDFPSVPEVEFTYAAGAISVVVPANCVSGQIILTSASGLTTSVEITVPLATFTSVEPNDDVREGDEITITGTLFDRIIELQLPGGITLAKGEFTQTPTTIKFTVPEGMGDGKVVMVQHENYSVETDKIMMHHEGNEIPIWQGDVHVGNWDGSMDALSWGKYDWSTVQSGQILSVYVTPDMSAGWSQIRFGNGSWSALPSTKGWGNDGNLDLTADDNVVRLTLTDADINALVNEGGLVLCGAWWTVTKVTLSALETTVWEGTFDEPAWTNWEVGKGTHGDGNPTMLIDAGVKVGSKIRIYATPTADWWQFQMFDGHWAGLTELGVVTGADNGNNLNAGNYDLSQGFIELPVNQALYDLLQLTDWGMAFIIQCENLVITKITLE